MESTLPLPRIIEAKRLDKGVIITFDDGKCAVFSASLLHAHLHQADQVLEGDDEIEP